MAFIIGSISNGITNLIIINQSITVVDNNSHRHMAISFHDMAFEDIVRTLMNMSLGSFDCWYNVLYPPLVCM